MRASIIALIITICTIIQLHSCVASNVEVLTDDNFDSMTASGSWLLEFYAPWCGHCKTLEPIYEQAAREVKADLRFAKIDATVNTALAKRYDIKGFPTIKFYREGEMRSYTGGRALSDFLSFAESLNKPPVGSASDLTEQAKVKCVFFGATGPEKRVFSTIAFRFQGLVEFLQAVPPLADSEKQTKVVMVSKRKRVEFTGPWTEQDLKKFVLAHKLPLVSELGADNFDDITTSGKRMVFALINSRTPSLSETYLDPLYALAEKHTNYIFASVDGIKFHKYISQFQVQSPQHLPTTIIIDPSMDYYWTSPIEHPLPSDEIARFLAQVDNGELDSTGTIPWYNPGRYVKLLEKKMSVLPVWLVVIICVIFSLSLLFLMFYCCFSGLDAAEEEHHAAAHKKHDEQGEDDSPEDEGEQQQVDDDEQEEEQTDDNEGVQKRK